MKILHIAPDEKFINSIHWQFEQVFPNESQYHIYLNKNTKRLKYIDLKKNIKVLDESKKSLDFILNSLEKYDLVVLHGLKYFQSQIVLKARNSVKFIWFFWGGEIYDNPKGLAKEVIGEKTKKKFFKIGFQQRLKSWIRPIFYYSSQGSFTPENLVLKAAKKIKHIGVIHEEEVSFLEQKGFIGDSTTHVKMTYYPLEFIFDGIENMTITHQNILLGNSASQTNNHLEAFDMLQEFDLGERKLMVPLSYGDASYAKEISEIGKNIFSNNFHPLEDFIPLKEYNKILQQCGIVVMNHYRQQAVGNILAMLWMGAKVFLDDRNTFYHFLKRIKVHVYSIKQDLSTKNPKVFVMLNKEEIANNRKILINKIGFENLKIELRSQLIKVVNEP